jgi:hypothetical protein
MPKGLSPLNWLDDFLYLPEVLYVLFFIWLICSGPGKFSVDYWLAGKLLEVIDRSEKTLPSRDFLIARSASAIDTASVVLNLK